MSDLPATTAGVLWLKRSIGTKASEEVEEVTFKLVTINAFEISLLDASTYLIDACRKKEVKLIVCG